MERERKQISESINEHLAWLEETKTRVDSAVLHTTGLRGFIVLAQNAIENFLLSYNYRQTYLNEFPDLPGIEVLLGRLQRLTGRLERFETRLNSYCDNVLYTVYILIERHFQRLEDHRRMNQEAQHFWELRQVRLPIVLQLKNLPIVEQMHSFSVEWYGMNLYVKATDCQRALERRIIADLQEIFYRRFLARI